MRQPSLAVGLMRRFVRSPRMWTPAPFVFVAGAFVMAMYVGLATLSLTGIQVADRDLGRFDFSAGYGTIVLDPGEGQPLDALDTDLRRTGVSDFVVVLTAPDFTITPSTGRNVTLVEADWSADPYPNRYLLKEGRWPRLPGEVVMADPGGIAASPGAQLPALGGGVTLKVVGIADDLFANSLNVLAAPGTWNDLDRDLRVGFPALVAQPYVLWSSTSPEVVIESIVASSTRLPEGSSSSGDDPVAHAMGTLVTRVDLLTRPERAWLDKSPAGYRVPAILLPLIAMLAFFGHVNSRLRASRQIMIDSGVSPATALAGIGGAALIVASTAAITGLAAGSALGLLLRPALAAANHRPPGSVNGALGAAVQFFILMLLTAFIMLATLRVRAPERTKSRSPGMRRLSRFLAHDLRQLGALACGLGAVMLASLVDSPAKAMVLLGVLTGLVLLTLPELTALLGRMPASRHAPTRLARRRLAADPRRTSATLGAVTVLIGASLGSLALLDTLIQTADSQSYPDALPGQLLLVDRSNSALNPAPQTTSVVSQVQGLAELPHFTLARTIEVDRHGEALETASLPGADAIFLVVDSSAQAEALLGQPLSPGQSDVLNGGGLLVWSEDAHPPDPGPTVTLEVRRGDIALRSTPDLPTAPARTPLVEWRLGTDGVLLRSTAQSLDVPFTRSGPTVISGVSDDQVQAVLEAFATGGADGSVVHVHRVPPPAVPPVALRLTTFSLALLALLSVAALGRAQSRALRPYLATLRAIGLSTGWLRRAQLIEQGLPVVWGAALGLLIAVTPPIVLATSVPGYFLSIPWTSMLVLLASLLLATVIAALISVRGIRLRDASS